MTRPPSLGRPCSRKPPMSRSRARWKPSSRPRPAISAGSTSSSTTPAAVAARASSRLTWSSRKASRSMSLAACARAARRCHSCAAEGAAELFSFRPSMAARAAAGRDTTWPRPPRSAWRRRYLASWRPTTSWSTAWRPAHSCSPAAAGSADSRQTPRASPPSSSRTCRSAASVRPRKSRPWWRSSPPTGRAW